MNTSHLEHAIFALIMQTAIWLLTGDLMAGAAFGAAFFIGREHTQAEYRWIEQFGAGKRANLPLFGGFSPAVWKLDALLDWVVPVVAVVLMYFFVGYIK